MKLNKFTRILCLAIVSVLIMASTAMAVNVNSFVDFPNDWSTPAMEYAVENGLIKGYEDNTIRADRNITRAEMGAIVNRAFGSFVEATKFPYLDVEDVAWFYKDMKKAVNMGTMQGSNNLLRPDDAITREEAFIVIARAYSQKNTEFSVLEQYEDYENISGWAKEYLSFLTENDYVNGFDDGNLYPKSNLTRAELSQVLYNMISEYVASQEVLDTKTEYDGNIIINGKITNITGKTFKGDLVIGDGVGVEKIVIKDTKIDGCLTVRGTTQIKLVNTTVGNRIIVNNPNNNVHFDNYKTEKVFNNVEVQTSATWKKHTSSGGKRYFTVTFVDEDGHIHSMTVAEGNTAKRPADPTRTGYTFGGWYTDENCTTPYDFTTPVNGNLTIYAKWIPNKYTVTFNYNGGTPGVTEKEVTYDSTYGEFPETAREGYIFEGWFIGNEKIAADTQVKITSDTEAKAKWTAKTYTLSFDSKGGSAVADKTVTYDSAIGMLTIPAKTGYTFKGWTIDGDLINLTTVYKYATNKVAEANWEANKYTLTFEGLADEIEVTYDGKYPTLPAGPEQAGKTFVGWFDGSTQIKEGNPVKITEDTHLKAKYTDKAVYTVTFDANGGSGSLTQSVIDGEKAVKPTDPTREGYDFKGWYNEPSGDTEFDFNTPITSTKTVYAKWEIKTYTVTFKDWNGNVLDIQTVNYGATAVYGGVTPSRASDSTYTYTFDGWDKPLTNIKSDITVNAKYISTYIDYTVKFVAEGETVKTFVKHYNDVIYVVDFPAVPSKTGYTGKWDITTDITVNSSIEVKAVYTPATYKLTFEGLTDEIDVTYGEKYPTLPTPSIPHGQNFVGWFDGSIQIKAGNTVEITKDTKLEPVFTDKAVYTVTFNANGGTPNSTQSVIDGDKAVKPTNPTREGYTFGGWFKDEEATQTFDFNTEITSNIELYAGWSTNTYKITFKNWDGSVLEEKEIPYGTDASYTGATPTKPADAQYTYTFAGWSPALGTVTGEAEYTAQFTSTVNKYTVNWVNEDGTVLETDTVEYGTIPTYDGATPTKASTAEFSYTFKEWTPVVEAVTGEAVYTATYTSTKNTYKVTWVNEDGTVLETDTVEYGTVPTYDGATPTKASTVEYSYTFKEWSPTVEAVTGEATYTATYTATLNSYKITFKNWDGSVLEEKEIPYGTDASYTGATPTKPADVQYTYTFSGWSPALETVTGEAEYTAQFTSTVNKYTVNWVNEDGTVLETDTVEYGTVPTYDGATPTKASTVEYSYTFKEWSPVVEAVTGAATYTATYTETLNSYEITFKNYDGTVLETKTINYGETVAYTGATPERPADAEFTYTFSGWSPALGTVTGEAEYVAQFTTTLNKYTVKWVNEDGSVLETDTVEYGTVPTYDGATPTKASTVEYSYTFKEWSPTVEAVTGEATYTATYTATLNSYKITFKNWDGSVLEEKEIPYGTDASYTGATPTKPADVQYTYTFSGWSPALETVASEAEYVAQFTTTVNKYTYIFYDEDGVTEIKKETVDFGAAIVPPANPTKTGEAGYTYSFKQWEGYTDGMTVTGDVTFKAVYDKNANEYDVIYDGNGATIGETAKSHHIYDQESNLSRNNFFKVGNTFLGWSKDANATTATYGDNAVVKNLTTSGEITLYAIWQPKPYYVSYDANTGTGNMSNSTHYYGVASSLSKNVFEKTGYTFKGWSEIATSADFTYADEAIISDLRANSETVTLYAIWEANKYTVKFNGNGNTSGSTEAMRDVEYDKSYNLTVNGFAKTGHTFKGWATEEAGSVVYTDGASVSNLTAVPNGTVELYAVWEPITYKVKFIDTWNSSLNIPYEQDFVYDVEDALTPNQFTRRGWVVVKWTGTDGTEYEPEALVKNLASTEGAVVELTASWMPIEYTVVYEGNGADGTTDGTLVMGESYHKFDKPQNLNDNTYVKEGYTFLGWRIRIIENPTTFSTRRLLMAAAESVQFTDQQEVTNLTDISGAKVILEAIWEANKYFVEYNKNDPAATGTMTNSEHIYDTTSVLSTNGYSLTGYTFGGWAKTESGNAEINDGANVLNLTSVPNGVVTLYATWTENSYTVKFDGNGATSGEMSDMTYTYTESKALNENKFERTGYTFGGWATSSGATTAERADKESVSMLTAENNGTVTLYAVWKPITYSVSYNGNGATEGTMSDSTHTYDKEDALTANTYKKAGFAFKGWDTDSAGETVVYKDAENVKNLADEQGEIVTLYAVWGEEEYKVIYDGNGATEGSMDPSTHITDTPEALSKNAFKKTGHNFLGWSEDKDAEVATYADEQVVVNLTTEKTITLYAIWEEATYKLTFDVNGGNALELTAELEALGYYLDGGKVTVDVTYNGKYPQFPTATYPEGEMSFGGWSLDDEIVSSGDLVEIEKDTEFVAVWTNKHIVVFHGYYNDGVDSLTTYVEDGETAVKPENPVHSQFTFDGWYTNEECTDGNEYDFATIINKVNDEYQTVHLYPRWLITVRFYYGPEAIESEKKAEITVQYNTVIAEEDIPASRVAYGYWKDASVSDAYVGEEYEHNIEFMWYEESGDDFELFDLTQPITKSLDLFNIAKVVDINVSSSFDAIDGANVGAVYTDNEPLYENILDVIFANGNLVNSVYEKIEKKEKVFDKLESLGIIDENKNILNQAKFLKFALIGEERLETFVYENVENELAVDAKESISSYLNHLIEKNDGSAESFIRELIETLLKGDGKEAMKGVLKDMLTEMVDLEKEEFVKHINDYIDNSLAKGDTTSVETLIAPQIERLLTEAIAKDFVREMTKDQLENFVKIYIDTLSENELKAEVTDYINGLSEEEIEAEVYEYFNGLTDAEVEAEITKYINGLSDEQLKEEIFAYVDGLGDTELKEAIIEHINTLSDAELEIEIKNYFNGLDDAEKKEEITKYFDELSDDEIKSEIITYIKELSDEDLEKEIKDYITNLSADEKKAEVRKYIDGLSDPELSEEIKNYINDLGDVELTAEIKKYIEGLGEPELTSEIKNYINNLDDVELTAEIKKYIEGLGEPELTSEIKNYINNLDDVELTAEIKKYINGFDDDELIAEIGKYIEGLSNPELTAEIKKYITGLDDTQKTAEIKNYINNLDDAELTIEIKGYITGLDDTQKTAEIKKYIDGLEDSEKEREISSYVKELDNGAFEAEIKGYIEDLEPNAFKAEIETYLTENEEEYKKLVNEYLGNEEDFEVSDELKEQHFDDVIDYAVSPEKKNDTIKKAAKYITDNKRADYEEEIIQQVTGDFGNYIDKIVEKVMASGDLDGYVENAAEKVVKSSEKESYIDSVVTNVVNGANLDGYIDKAVEEIVNGDDKNDYIEKVAEKVVNSGDKDSYINSAVEKIVNGTDKDSYISSAAEKIVKGADKDSYINSAVEKIVNGADRDSYINSAVEKIVNGADRDSYINSAVEKIVNGTDKDSYINSAVEKIVSGADRDSYINSAVDKIVTDGKLETYIPDVVEKIVSSGDIDSYVTNAVDNIIAKGELDSYIESAIDAIISGSKLDTYVAKAVENIMASDKKSQYIEETALAIATGSNRQDYVEKAADTIVKNPELKAKYTQKAIDEIVGSEDEAEYVEKAVKKILGGEDRDKYINDTINKIFADGKYQKYIDKAVAKIVDKTPADYSEIDKHITNMFETAEKKQKLVDYINDQFIENGDFREAILPDAIDMIFKDEDAKAEVVETIVDYVMNDEEAFEEMIGIAIEDLVDDADFREKTIDKIAHYIEDHPEIMEKVLEYAKESELGVFVEKFIDELITKDQFEVNEDNLFVAEAIGRAVSKYDYDSFMNQYVPDRFAGLIPDSILKPIYENALGGFKSQLDTAIEAAKNGEVAYVDSGVTVKFNPIADIIVPVFDKYLEFKDKAEDKLDSNNGIVGDIYDNTYGENKYLKELVNLISIESLLDGDKSLATETLSGYSLKEFIDYYEIIRNATVLLTDTGRWYIEKLPKDKAEAAQEKVAQKVTEYFNSVLALVNTYAETEELPSYKDVLDIFEGDIPDRFFAKYESALGKVEAKVDIDDKLDTVYNKLAEKGIVSKFNTGLDKFIASKFNREITEEQIPLVYTIVRRALGYDDFYTVDTVFNVMNEYLTRFKVNEDKFEIGNNKLKITIERSYK